MTSRTRLGRTRPSSTSVAALLGLGSNDDLALFSAVSTSNTVDDTITGLLAMVDLDFLSLFSLSRAFAFDYLGGWIRRHRVDGFHPVTLYK